MTPPIPMPRRARARRLTRAIPATVAAAALVLLGQSTADAHVRVQPDSTVSGSFSALTFRVPNESATAGTVELAVTLPTDTPFLYVSTKPVPGWQAGITEATLPAPVVVGGTTVTKAARTVTWTADPGVQIGPGQYQEFSISAGPLPKPGTVQLPATQTYSDGTVTTWDQPSPPGGPEPEHPAPAFVVTAAPATTTTPTTSPTMSPTGSAPVVAASAGGGDDPVARGLAGVGLLAGLAALAVAVSARRRRSSATGTSTHG
ncbi:MAG: YcnI family protein [Lapillicoccus sp.]